MRTLRLRHAIRRRNEEHLLDFSFGAVREDLRGTLAANPSTLDLDWIRQEWHDLADATVSEAIRSRR